MNFTHRRFFFTAALLLWVHSYVQAFDIVINPGAGLSANAPALAAFNRAAAQWEARITDPITITIDADLATLGAGILGQASSPGYTLGYNSGPFNVRNQMINDAANEPDDSIVASLPTIINATAPSGYTISSNIFISKANARALGYTFVTGSDASITFNSGGGFTFDYDNSNGVSGGQYDFQAIAAHEIGHALGFTSAVDNVDIQINQDNIDMVPNPFAIVPTTLDLFRFVDSANTSLDPIDAATFTTADRNFVPGATGITDFGTNVWGIGTEFRMSTGFYLCDGQQASHWKDSLGIGIMDPTLAAGELGIITEADFRSLDLIGYEIAAIPEPSTYALGAIGVVSLYWLRRKRLASRAELAT